MNQDLLIKKSTEELICKIEDVYINETDNKQKKMLEDNYKTLKNNLKTIDDLEKELKVMYNDLDSLIYSIFQKM